MTNKTLTPAPSQERDEYGLWAHPKLLELTGDREGPELDEFNRWCDEHNIEVCWILMQHDVDEDHPAFIHYFEDGEPGCLDWSPTPPDDSWSLLAIFETDDGPAAMWFRESQQDD